MLNINSAESRDKKNMPIHGKVEHNSYWNMYFLEVYINHVQSQSNRIKMVKYARVLEIDHVSMKHPVNIHLLSLL